MKRLTIALTSLILVLSFALPSFNQASAEMIGNEIVEFTEGNLEGSVSIEETARVERMVNSINELDKKIGLENLENLEKLSDIDQNLVDSLSKETQDFFNFVKKIEQDNNNAITSENGLAILSTYVQSLDSKNDMTITPYSSIASTIGSIKDYKISNAQMKELNLLVNGNTGFWTLSAAIASIWKKSPTTLTKFIVAIPIIGLYTLNVCNKKGKGIIITDVRVGASHSFSCKSQ